MRRHGQVTGYLSVRTKPSRTEVDATQALYQRFKEGRAAGLAFHRGMIVRTGLLQWLSALQLLPTAWRVRLPLLGWALQPWPRCRGLAWPDSHWRLLGQA